MKKDDESVLIVLLQKFGNLEQVEWEKMFWNGVFYTMA